MKLILSILFTFGLAFAGDATIEVVKKVDALPSIAIEDSSISYDDTFKLQFFKSIVADLNVISIFNVDRFHRKTHFNDTSVLVENKDMSYVLRYKVYEDDSSGLHVDMKIIQNDEDVFSKSYRVSRQNIYMFVTHAMAYDIN